MNGNGTSNGTQVHQVVGRSIAGRIHLYSRPYGVTHLVPGYVVHTNGHYQRVYEDGRRGLRYWCVDELVRLEKERTQLAVPA